MLASRILELPGVVHHSGLGRYEEIHMQGPNVATMVGEPKHETVREKEANNVPYDLDWERVTELLLNILEARRAG